MSTKVLNYVWRNSKAKSTMLLVLVAIADMADDEGRAWPGLEYLAEKNRLSRRYIIDVIHKLELSGEISIVRRKEGERNLSNLYQVVMVSSPSSEFQGITPDEPEITKVVNASSPESSINHQIKHQIKEEEAPPSTIPSLTGQKDFPEGESILNIFTTVTGMCAIPGDLSTRNHAIDILRKLTVQHGDRLTSYLKPFYLAQVSAKNKTGSSYSKSALFWLTDWAPSGQIPDCVLKQLPESVLFQMGAEWKVQADLSRMQKSTQKCYGKVKPLTVSDLDQIFEEMENNGG